MNSWRTSKPIAKQFSSAEILGGQAVLKKLPCTDWEWILMVRQGISASSIHAAADFMGVTKRELAGSLNITASTLWRREKIGVLNRYESERLVRLAGVIARAIEVFENKQSALDWITNSNISLGGISPVALLDTEMVAKVVVDALGRIEHGVFTDIYQM